MLNLSDLAVHAPTVEKPARPKGTTFFAEVQDNGSGQSIIFASDRPISSYTLEGAPWGEGEKHCDGVVIGEVDGVVLVCFVEIKGRYDQKASEQIQGAALHFHPTANSHGAEHHQRWGSDDQLDIAPPRDHRVLGLAVAFRLVPRPPPVPAVSVNGQDVPFRNIQISGRYNRAVVVFDEILKSNGLA